MYVHLFSFIKAHATIPAKGNRPNGIPFKGYPSHKVTLSRDDARMVSIETRVQIRAFLLIHSLQSDSNGTLSNPSLG